MINLIVSKRFNLVGKKIFLDYKSNFKYHEVVKISISSSTYRSFWRIDKSKPGAKKNVDSFLLNENSALINSLKLVSTETELEKLSHRYCEEIRRLLQVYIKPDANLNSYNKTRKLIDLFLEHLVSLSSDLKDHRCDLVPLLFVPLDSQILTYKELIDKTTRTQFRITNTSSFACIETRENYKALQEVLKKTAVDLGINHRIYLDLIWNNRYQSDADNLIDLTKKI